MLDLITALGPSLFSSVASYASKQAEIGDAAEARRFQAKQANRALVAQSLLQGAAIAAPLLFQAWQERRQREVTRWADEDGLTIGRGKPLAVERERPAGDRGREWPPRGYPIDAEPGSLKQDLDLLGEQAEDTPLILLVPAPTRATDDRWGAGLLGRVYADLVAYQGSGNLVVRTADRAFQWPHALFHREDLGDRPTIVLQMMADRERLDIHIAGCHLGPSPGCTAFPQRSAFALRLPRMGDWDVQQVAEINRTAVRGHYDLPVPSDPETLADVNHELAARVATLCAIAALDCHHIMATPAYDELLDDAVARAGVVADDWPEDCLLPLGFVADPAYHALHSCARLLRRGKRAQAEAQLRLALSLLAGQEPNPGSSGATLTSTAELADLVKVAGRHGLMHEKHRAKISVLLAVLGGPGALANLVSPDAPEPGDSEYAEKDMVSLQSELRRHAAAGNWQAVLDIDADLADIAPSSSDLDGLASRARTELAAAERAADLERRYAQARATEDKGMFASAAICYNEIAKIDAAYRDVVTRRDLCLERDQAAWPPRQFRKRPRKQGRAGARFKKQPPTNMTKRPYSQLAIRGAFDLVDMALSGDSSEREPASDILSVSALTWHPTGRRLAVARSTSVIVHIVSGAELAEASVIKCANFFNPVVDVTFSPDGTKLATASSKRARIWDVASNQMLLELLHGKSIAAVTFSPDGSRLATASADTSARIWDATSGQMQLAVGHGGAVTSVTFSPDGSQLATASADTSARIWDATSGQMLDEVFQDKSTRAVRFSPDGSRLATGGTDTSARIWDINSKRTLLEVRHGKPVAALAFSPDGTRLATASLDKSARIWDADTGQMLFEAHHGDLVTAVAFSPDGTQLATGCNDMSARIWPLPG